MIGRETSLCRPFHQCKHCIRMVDFVSEFCVDVLIQKYTYK